jgi:hypothetical protein
MVSLFTLDNLAGIVGLIPDSWLPEGEGFESKDGQREAYLNYFTARAQSSAIFLQEAIRARSVHV